MPVSAIVAENIWWVCLVIYLIIRIPHRRRAQREPVLSSRSSLWDWPVRQFGTLCFAILPLIYIITDSPAFATYPFFPPFVVVGPAIFAAGLWFIHRSLNDLGRGFSPTLEIRPDHQLITAGVYQYVRHPMYLGFLLWAIAQAVMLPNWIAGPAALVAWAVLVAYRLRREEAMMLDQFGDQYRAYMARTARLVPGVF
jgi:protein-S-isoprenylcysteine O-methyltransferase Ste14